MYRRFCFAVAAGCLVGMLGLAVSLTPLGSWLEEDLGLYILFHLRGPRPVPPGVVVVALDEVSAEKLGLSGNPQKWPRYYYTRLIEILARQQPSVIAFDILFSDPTVQTDDDGLAQAVFNAGNVILCERLKKETIPVSSTGQMYIERTIPPMEILANSAALLAPFPLPKFPSNVSQIWTFKTGAGCRPTFPVAAFQIYALSAYREFVQLMEAVSPDLAGVFPGNADEIGRDRKVGWLIAKFRNIFEENPSLPDTMAAKRDSVLPGLEVGKERILESLIRLYSQPDSFFVNFYGPPGSIPTIPIHEIIESGPSASVLSEFKGKAVFVGSSETLNPEQRDGFRTVFSKEDGTDLSGVEIAATAFANLIENLPIRQLPPKFLFALIFLYGFILSVCAMLFPAVMSVCVVVAGTVAYTLVVRYEFASGSLWIPLGIPVLLLSPLAFAGCFFRNFHHVRVELERVRKAFGFFLPAKVIDQIVRDMSHVEGVVRSGQTMFAAVLCSDGEQYARLAEMMRPEDLNDFLNRFYESVFRVVEANHGTISDIIGDSMLALWATVQPDPSQRRNACRAAWSVMKAVQQFNEQNRPFTLGARIGLHYGEILLGTVGGVDHYEYRPIGDVVNTASRIENLNKHFQTKILVTGTVIDGLEDFLLRELGQFVLGGKATPVTVFELVCPIEESDRSREHLSSIFSAGLRAFEKQQWDTATALFQEYLGGAGNDAAAVFYLRQCGIYKQNSPGASWDGLVSIGRA